MKPVLNEQMVLRRLGIEDFRHMTKDKVVEMASMLDRMDPEVAMKALDQFPNFSGTMRDIFINYQAGLSQISQENQESVNSYYATCDSIISACIKELEKPDLEFEERKFIIDSMRKVADMKKDMDADNKRFSFNINLLSLTFLGAICFMLLAAIGGNARITINPMK